LLTRYLHNQRLGSARKKPSAAKNEKSQKDISPPQLNLFLLPLYSRFDFTLSRWQLYLNSNKWAKFFWGWWAIWFKITTPAKLWQRGVFK
jgi:hypothetical protein